jgi:hypothetical protein
MQPTNSSGGGWLHSLLLRLPEPLDPIVLWLEGGRSRVSAALAGLAALVLAAVALAGGFGKGVDDETKAAIAETIEFAFSSNPESCGVATQNYLEVHFSSSEDESPLEDCRQDTLDHSSMPESEVTLLSIEENDGVASATVAVTEGSYGTAEMELRVVDQGGWKIDAITAIQIDKEHFLAAQRRQIEESPPIQAALETCVLDWVDQNVPIEEINAAIPAGSDDYTLGAISACLEPARVVFIAGLRAAVAARGASPAQVRCIAYQVRESMSDAELSAILEAHLRQVPPPARILQGAFRSAAVCGTPVPSGDGLPNV